MKKYHWLVWDFYFFCNRISPTMKKIFWDGVFLLLMMFLMGILLFAMVGILILVANYSGWFALLFFFFPWGISLIGNGLSYWDTYIRKRYDIQL